MLLSSIKGTSSGEDLESYCLGVTPGTASQRLRSSTKKSQSFSLFTYNLEATIMLIRCDEYQSLEKTCFRVINTGQNKVPGTGNSGLATGTGTVAYSQDLMVDDWSQHFYPDHHYSDNEQISIKGLLCVQFLLPECWPHQTEERVSDLPDK